MMTHYWHGTDRNREARAEASFQDGIRRLGWRRLDGVYVLCVFGIVLCLALAGVLLAIVAHRMGWLERGDVVAVEDPRLLTNVRDRLSKQPLLDGVQHNAQVYVAKAGGEIHRFEPTTELWDLGGQIGDDVAMVSDIARFRSGCGDDPLAMGTEDCPDRDTLWALTQNRGLVRMIDGEWTSVIGDRAWIGPGDVPVSGAAALAAAASDDGRWLVFLTANRGVGFYHRGSHSWWQVPATLQQFLGLETFRHAVYADGAFWLGGDKRLVVVRPSNWQFREVQTGAVTDLDSDGRQIWALLRVTCDRGGECAELVHVAGYDSLPKPLIQQRNRFRELSLSDVQFAHAVGEKVALAGTAGVLLYDPSLRAWEPILDERVTVTADTLDGLGFYVGFDGGVARIDQGRFAKRWVLPGQNVVRLVPTARDGVLALTQTQAVYLCFGTESVEELISPMGTQFDPERFRNAVAIGDTLMFSGPEGLLFHDVIQRNYQDVPADQSTAFVTAGNPILKAAGSQLFAFRRIGNEYEVNNFSLGDIRNAAFRYRERMQRLPAPLRTIQPWGEDALGVLAGDNRAFLVEKQRVSQLAGSRLRGADVLQIFDAATTQGQFFLATATGVHQYDLATRVWTSHALPGRRPLVELTDYLGQAVGRDNQDRMFVVAGANDPILGGGLAIGLDDDELEDVWMTDRQLFLAGGGKVVRYHLDNRVVEDIWDLPTAGPIRLVDVLNERPLMVVGSGAYWGQRRLDNGDADVVDLFAGAGYLWIQQQRNGRDYLRRIDPNSNRDTCLFRRSLLPETVSDIQDVVALDATRLVVATNAGVWFYDASYHGWFAGPDDLLPRGGRIHKLGDSLVFSAVASAGYQLYLAGIDDLQWPDSCSDDAVILPGRTVQVRDYTYKQGEGNSSDQLYWLEASGAVATWENRSIVQVLPPPQAGPNLARVETVVAASQGSDDGLFVADPNGLWHYNGLERQWRRVDTNLDDVKSWLLLPTNEGVRAVATLVDGSIAAGQLMPNASTARFDTIYRTGAPLPGLTSGQLLDVQHDGSARWLFLFNDRLAFFDPLTRVWRVPLQFEEPDSQLQLNWAGDLPIVVAGDRRTWWIGQREEGTPTTFHRWQRSGFRPAEQLDGMIALDANSVLWLLREDGSLWQQFPNQSGGYEDPVLYRRPLQVESDSVRAAYRWDNVLLLDTAAGLRAYQELLDLELRVPDPIAGMTRLRDVRAFLGRLGLYDGQRLVELTQSDDALIVARTIDDVADFRLDANGQPWVLRAGQWYTLQDNRFQSWPSGGAQRVFVTENGAASALRDRQLLRKGQSAAVQLPTGWSADTLRFALPAGRERWWLASDDSLTLFRETPCGEGLCLASVRQWQVPTDVFTQPIRGVVNASAGQLVLALGAGGRLIVDENMASDQVVVERGSQWQARGVLSETWATLRTSMATMADGRQVYNPYRRLALDASDALIAFRDDDYEELASRGMVTMRPRPALDLGWLRWNRDQNQFQYRHDTTWQSLTADQTIQDGRFFFETIRAMFPDGPVGWQAANASGFFHFSQLDTNLHGPGIQYRPARDLAKITAHQGYFQVGNRYIGPLGRPMAGPPDAASVSVGHLQVTLNDDGVQWFWALPGDRRRLDVAGGFPWDRARRGLTFVDNQLVLQHNAGLSYLSRLRGPAIDRGNLDWRALRFWPDVQDEVIVQTNTGWATFRAGRWVPTDDPRRASVLLDSNYWLVRRGEAGPRFMPGRPRTSRVNLPDQQKAPSRPVLSWLRTATGSGFAVDQLQSAKMHGDYLFVLSREGLDLYDARRSTSVTAATPIDGGAESLFARRTAQGDSSVFRRVDGKLERWAPGGFRNAADSRDFEMLAVTSRLRFRREISGQISKQIRLTDAQGREHWRTFSFMEGRFPFDRATALEAFGSRLMIGTPIGLVVMKDRMTGSLSQAERIYATDGAVERIGRRVDVPNRIIVEAAGERFVMDQLGQRLLNETAPVLAQRLRAISDLWLWTQAPNGTLQGVYRDAVGNATSMAVDFQTGRPNHDRLLDIIMVGGEAHLLWRDGIVESHRINTPRLTDAFSIFDTRSTAPQHFLYLAHDKITAQTVVPAGLYLMGERGHLRFHSRQWQTVTDAQQVSALVDHQRNPPIYHRRDLRIRQPAAGQPFAFEYRSGPNTWQPLRWTNSGRLEIDNWRAFGVSAGALWVATRGGALKLSVNAVGRPALDPNAMNLVESLGGDIDMGEITDIAEFGTGLVVRLNNDPSRVYQVTLAQDRQPKAVPWAGDDPFASRLAIGGPNDYWQWRVRGRERGETGSLQVQVVGEDIQLTNGVFTTDDIQSVAFMDGRLMVATANAGLYELPQDNHHLRHQQRPNFTDVSLPDVRYVGKTRRGDQAMLLLDMRDGSTMRYRPGEEPESVAEPAEFIADDGFWIYEQTPAGLRIRTERSTGGTALRSLQDGRFTDDQLLGFPVPVRQQGELIYFLPSEAGVLELTDTLQVKRLHAPPFPGLAEGESPKIIYWPGEESAPIYLASHHFYALTGRREQITDEPLPLPDDVEPYDLTRGAFNTMVFSWQKDSGYGWNLITRDDYGVRQANVLYINARQMAAFAERRLAWGDPDPWLRLDFDRNGLTVRRVETATDYRIPIAAMADFQRLLRVGDDLWIVAASDLLKVDLGNAIRHLYQR